MEGHLPCLKYLLSNAANTNSLVTARNDQVNCIKNEYLSNITIINYYICFFH